MRIFKIKKKTISGILSRSHEFRSQLGIKIFDLAKLQQQRRKKILCDSKWVFSNSILFGENKPSWSALFSHDAGSNSSPQRKELGFYFFILSRELPQIMPDHSWSPHIASTGSSHHHKVLKKHVCRSKITHFIWQ